MIRMLSISKGIAREKESIGSIYGRNRLWCFGTALHRRACMPPRKYDDGDIFHVFAHGRKSHISMQPVRFRPRIQLLVMAFGLYCRKLFPWHQGGHGTTLSLCKCSISRFNKHRRTDTFRLWITTECGKLQESPCEIAILPQGFRFAVDLPDGPSRGYVAEIFGTHFQLPDLGPIGIFFFH
ncbi:uncharacterized protein LOC119989204 isoform X3 [Tripterygium wilfordii]|uniref:uncharacterized protein LOC119989204 isoform X3 n=1 Tax=Tripterygium wilfordii TaxID=458696 RepID=UPI0018F8063A|nr:uncharacterized protein LOC119989204 isoform X3 [Tripterygium wilfordii]